ncbi:MAG: malto-oligosyltrehalose trehalohydrolase, partial [Candidatus Omnitrophica bacterium]|nr:malto-oligosyltrehalose trehalohydrolase [Candidatus Omnitrophota bacterium]
MNIGATFKSPDQCAFCVWAPLRDRVDLHLVSPLDRQYPMQKDDQGYWHCQVDGIDPGATYCFVLDGNLERPDPASRFQPADVHSASGVIDPQRFAWSDAAWSNIPLAELIIYEIHVGTFTPEGTFTAIIPRLKELRDMGITAIEIMPVAQFPGDRNWGYDGVYPFAVQNSYGGPDGLKQLIDASHAAGMAVILDVVYNHLGPEGNYLHGYGPYFTQKYRTPWGEALNFDDAYNEGVRNYFIQNALYWFEDFHIDGLRLDAVHAIFDSSAKPFLSELQDDVAAWSKIKNKPVYLIAESDLNDARIINDRAAGGFGLKAQWSDDFHHAMHALLTGEKDGYYRDFGGIRDVVKSLTDSFVYDWAYS